MNTNGIMKWSLVLASAVLLASCSNTKHAKIGKSGSSNKQASAVSTGVGQSESFWGEELATMSDDQLLERNTFYFSYDSSNVNDNYKRALQAHARYLKDNPNAKMRLEGHTDERGSTEYNIALGERRAQSVERIMTSEGARADQIDIVSYGRQKPAMNGHDESAWKFNRRAIVVYEES